MIQSESYNKMFVTKNINDRKKVNLVILICSIAVSSCANFKGPAYQAAKQDKEIFNTPLRPAKHVIAPNIYLPLEETDPVVSDSIQILATPSLNIEEEAVKALNAVVPNLKDTTVNRLSFNKMPVPVYINEVFGNQLGLNFVIEPSLKSSVDLVTMRLNEAVKQKDLYELATQTLKSYGVTTSIKNNAISFSFSENASGSETPILITGRALPEVPSTSRPIFYIYQLKAVTTNQVRAWISNMFPNNEIKVMEDPGRNAMIFIGPAKAVEQAKAATQLLDKPTMREMFSSIIQPNISSVKDLAQDLENVLKAEGYAVKQTDGATAIRLLPLKSTNQLVVFAKSREILAHVIEWAKTLEKEQHAKIDNGLFTYAVQSTAATHIVKVLGSLGVAEYQDTEAESASDDTSSASTRISANRRNNQNSSGTYAVDEQLNTILYRGRGKDWLQTLPIIKSLDKPAPSVLVEVIIAEITLGDKEETGVDIINATSSLGSYALDFSTSAAGLVTNVKDMFSTAIDNAGQTRATLKALSTSTKASIRSKPRIMVKSGGEATIEVGDEISVQTGTALSDGGTSATQFSYRKTGVILTVKPTVHASGFVEIEISQELSAAAEGADSTNPDIRNRSLSTTVTLRDGGSILLGGLISSTSSTSNKGVPILSKLPYFGKLFGTDTDAQDRTELMIMVIPYILNSPSEAEQLTDELQKNRIEDLSSGLIID